MLNATIGRKHALLSSLVALLLASLSLSSAQASNQTVYIDKTGKETTPQNTPALPPGVQPSPSYVYLPKTFTDGLAWFRSNDLYGYMDESGRIVIRPQFKHAGNFSEGAAICQLSGPGFVIIDKKGNVRSRLPEPCVPCGEFHDGLASCWYRVGNYNLAKSAFVDQDGKLAFPPTRGAHGDYSNGLVMNADKIGKARLYGYLDKTGKQVIPIQYEKAYAFSEHLAAVYKDGRWSYIDSTGKPLIKLPADCKEVGNFSEGLAAVAFGGELIKDPKSRNTLKRWGILTNAKLGFIDKSGKLLIPTNFYAPMSIRSVRFSDGLAAVPVVQNGYLAWGYINHSGKFVVPARYKNASDFKAGKAKVIKGNFAFDPEEWRNCRHKGDVMRYPQLDEFMHQYQLIGMSKDAVLQLLGNPDKTKRLNADAEILSYEINANFCGNASEDLEIKCAGTKVVSFRKVGFDWADEWTETNLPTSPIPFAYNLL